MLLVWLVVLPIAALLIVPSAQLLMRADDPMPVPEETWDLDGAQVAPEQVPADWTQEEWVVDPVGDETRAQVDQILAGGRLRPDTVYVPALKIVLPFHDVGQTNGWLDLEYGVVDTGVRFEEVGSFEAGSQVISAHVNNRKLQLSPFARLVDAKRGMVVAVTDADAQPYYYKTTALNYYDKGRLPAEMWDDEGSPTVHLVTCGGRIARSPYDGRRHYTDNVVLRAEAFDPWAAS